MEPGGALAVLINNTTAASLPVTRDALASRVRRVGLSIVASYAWTGSPHVAPSVIAKAGVSAMT
jgi:hypothetical protein